MKLISHRGNISGPTQCLENTKDYIDCAINKGYDVEIDLRVKDNNLFLGHDEPQYKINIAWLVDRKNNLWIHCKDFLSLNLLINTDLVFFFHENEDYTIISNGMIWAHNLKEVSNHCIIPLINREDILQWDGDIPYGICSDYISLIK
jgi:hypothetical protein